MSRERRGIIPLVFPFDGENLSHKPSSVHLPLVKMEYHVLCKLIAEKGNDLVIIRISLWAEKYVTFLLLGYLNKCMVLLVRVLVMNAGEPTNYICCVRFSKCDLFALVSIGNLLTFRFFCSTSDLMNQDSVGGAQPAAFNGPSR